MTSWDLKETHTLVKTIYGRDQERLVQESTRSVNERKAFSSYHYTETQRLSDALERKHLSGLRTILSIHVAGAERKEAAFERYMVKAGAHSIAAVQSLHTLPDIFAHAVYFAAGKNLGPDALAEEKISLSNVVKILKGDKDFGALSTPLASLCHGDAWKHLAAAANMSKHRSVVRAVYNEDWTGKRENPRELQVAAFDWHGKHYPAMALRGLLEPEYDRLLKTIIAIGQQLNERLRPLVPGGATPAL